MPLHQCGRRGLEQIGNQSGCRYANERDSESALCFQGVGGTLELVLGSATGSSLVHSPYGNILELKRLVGRACPRSIIAAKECTKVNLVGVFNVFRRTEHHVAVFKSLDAVVIESESVCVIDESI